MIALILWDWSGTIQVSGQLNPKVKFKPGLNCIVSNHKSKNDIIDWCKLVHLEQTFPPDQIVCGDDGIQKPHIQMYLKLLNQIGPLIVSDLTMIGDSEVDASFAKNLAANFIHVTEL